MPSARELLEAKERRAWIEQERENENRQQYEKYVAQERGANSKVAPAHRVEPAPYSEFRKAMPDDQPDANIRGLMASSVVGLRRLGGFAIDRIKNAELSDPELEALGFRTSDRMVIPELLSAPGIAMAFEHFAKQDSRCDLKLHFHPMGDFLTRNNLFPSDEHIRLTFNHLWDVHAIEPAPEPERPEGVNEYGVNLGIERDPELEARISARKRLEDYATKVIMRGQDGKNLTQRDLDRLSADETLKVLRFNESLQRL
jgi:hypothetical protein